MATSLSIVSKTARDFSRTAGKTIDRARNQTGSALHRVATSMRRSSATIDDLTTGAAKRLDATASFVRDADLKRVVTGLRRFGQKHPAYALLVGAAVGFYAGSLIGRIGRFD